MELYYGSVRIIAVFPPGRMYYIKRPLPMHPLIQNILKNPVSSPRHGPPSRSRSRPKTPAGQAKRGSGTSPAQKHRRDKPKKPAGQVPLKKTSGTARAPRRVFDAISASPATAGLLRSLFVIARSEATKQSHPPSTPDPASGGITASSVEGPPLTPGPCLAARRAAPSFRDSRFSNPVPPSNKFEGEKWWPDLFRIAKRTIYRDITATFTMTHQKEIRWGNLGREAEMDPLETQFNL